MWPSCRARAAFAPNYSPHLDFGLNSVQDAPRARHKSAECGTGMRRRKDEGVNNNNNKECAGALYFLDE